MIEVQHLSKTYGAVNAVSDLSFHVSRGEICGFLGPNGAGKSTTLRMLTGFLAPSAGSVVIGGVDALAHPIEARRNIGYMPEASPLYPEMRVVEYLRYRAELKGVARRQVTRRVDSALEQAQITDVSRRVIGQLSKGYRQRVGLADALVADPPLLVLDEPTAGLDPNQIRQVRELIIELAKNKTVLLSTHILPEVEALCDRVLILHRGKLVQEGEPASLRGQIGGKQVLRIEGRGAPAIFEETLGALPGVQITEVKVLSGSGARTVVRVQLDCAPDPDIGELVFGAVAKAGLVLRELQCHQATLEDVFAHLTTDDASQSEGESGPPFGELIEAAAAQTVPEPAEVSTDPKSVFPGEEGLDEPDDEAGEEDAPADPPEEENP